MRSKPPRVIAERAPKGESSSLPPTRLEVVRAARLVELRLGVLLCRLGLGEDARDRLELRAVLLERGIVHLACLVVAH